MVFIDADKKNYQQYYDFSLELLKKNGLVIIDNVLWRGDVVNINNNENLTNIIRDFNTHVKNDTKIKNKGKHRNQEVRIKSPIYILIRRS